MAKGAYPIDVESSSDRFAVSADYLSAVINHEARALLDTADSDFARGRYASAADVYLTFEEQYEKLPSEAHTWLMLRLASALHGAGRWDEAYERFERAAAARPKMNPVLEIEQALAWSRVHESEGSLIGARALARDAFTRGKAANLHVLAAEAAYRAARLYGDRNPSDDVLEWVTRGLDILDGEPDRRLEMLLRIRRAVTEGALTTPTVAITTLQAMLVEAKDLPEVYVTILGYLADQHERRGELDRAREQLAEALKTARDSSFLRHEGRLAAHAAVVAHTQGELTKASHLFSAAIEIALSPEALHVPLLREISSLAIRIPEFTGGEASTVLRAKVKEALAALKPYLPATFSFQAQRRHELKRRVHDLQLALRNLTVRGFQFGSYTIHLGNRRLYVRESQRWAAKGKELHTAGIQAIVALDAIGGAATTKQISRIGGGKTAQSVKTALSRLCERLGEQIDPCNIVEQDGQRWLLRTHDRLNSLELERLINKQLILF